ncbi:MAG: ATP-binding protein, partial [Tannerella sp.]|nr:ATP-binding protein [Tannerella sp.]
GGLIEDACSKTGRKVVVLVDEYDKPLLASMNDPDLNEKMRNLLKGFYGVLKGSDASLRFVFLTGVTKFSKVSIFSDLNQLKDISMDERFAGVCGISESELLRDFRPELAALAEKRKMTRDEAFAEMKKRYDGYHFSCESEDMYNPFSVLNTFFGNRFGNYWFETGTPTFLVKMLKDVDFDIPKLENDIDIPADAIMDYRTDNRDPVPVLYQSGYLTIKTYNEKTNVYTLGIPNEEVKYGFFKELLAVYMPGKNINREFYAGNFAEDLWAHDIERFMTRLKAFFADIPYELNNREERHYQTVFYILFRLLGQFVRVEYRTATGRIDAVVETSDAVHVFEFKLEQNATAEQALAQIDAKDYLIPFTASGKQLVKIGVEFGGNERGVKRWATGIMEN